MSFTKSNIKIGSIVTLARMGDKPFKVTSLTAQTLKGEDRETWFKAVRFIKSRNDWSATDGVSDIKDITSIK